MADVTIQVESLGKQYILSHLSGRSYETFRDRIEAGARSLVGLFTRGNAPARAKEEFWALDDVSFSLERGDRLGIIGRNGAGKSTLLKILSRIVEPTRGRISIRGRVASLLEVGTGFHPELTGRENIYLNGAILGMHRWEIRKKFDEIVAFSEVERFLDTPVKRFSSGMYVRLAFAVAAHLEPEILVVDEVLAVGDAQFQKKCLGKMEDVSTKEGRTVLFVSHNMGAIRGLCSKVAWLDNGKLRRIGPTPEVVSEYLETTTNSDFLARSHQSDQEFSFRRVLVRDAEGNETRTLKPSEPFTVEVHYSATRPFERPHFWIDVIGAYGHLFGASMLFDNLCPERIEGDGFIACRFSSVTLLPQTYTITVRARGANGTDILTPTIPDAAIFQVVGTAADYGMTGALADHMLEHDSPMIVPYEWIYPDGRRAAPAWQRGGGG